MAEGQQIEKAEGMEEALILEIFGDFRGQRREVGGDVGVGENDTFRVSGGAGGEDDFEGIGGLNVRLRETFRWMMRDDRGQVGGIKHGHVSKKRSPLSGTNNKPGSNLLADAAGEVRGGSIIDRNRDHTAGGAG